MRLKNIGFLGLLLSILLVYPASAQSYSLRKIEVTGYGTNVVLSPDGHTLAVYDDAGLSNNEVDPALLPIRLVNLDDGKEMFTLTDGITDFTSSLTFTSDGKWLASEQQNGNLTVWDTSNGQLVNTYANTIGGHLLAFLPESKLLLDAAGMNTVLWNLDSGVIERIYRPEFDTYAAFQEQMNSGIPSLFMAGLAPQPDGQSFVMLTSAGGATLNTTASSEQTVLLPAFTEASDTLRRVNPTLSPDGKLLLFGDFKDKQIHVVDMSTLQDLRQIDVITLTTAHFFAVASDNDTLAVLQPAADGDTGVVHLYSLATGSSLLDIPIPTKPRGRFQIAFTPDGKQVVMSGFWDLERSGHNVVYIADLTG